MGDGEIGSGACSGGLERRISCGERGNDRVATRKGRLSAGDRGGCVPQRRRGGACEHGKLGQRRGDAFGQPALGTTIGQVQVPDPLRRVGPVAHPLRGMSAARPLPDLLIGNAARGIAGSGLDAERRRGGRKGVVVGAPAAAPGRKVGMRNPPRGERAASQRAGVRGQRDGCQRCARHRPVMAVLPWNIKEGRQDHVGPIAAIGQCQPLGDQRLAPAGEGVVAVLGETEIMYRIRRAEAEPRHVAVKHSRGLLHLAAA